MGRKVPYRYEFGVCGSGVEMSVMTDYVRFFFNGFKLNRFVIFLIINLGFRATDNVKVPFMVSDSQNRRVVLTVSQCEKGFIAFQNSPFHVSI